jgi:hypothetical protein
MLISPGGTYSNTINRVTGLVAGTVVPSILSFFVCKASNDVLYNFLNNAVLFIWTAGSMYVYFTARYMRAAGMVSAYMAVSVLLSNSCRSSSSKSTSSLSYTTLTENSMGIITLMLVELCIRPHSARDLLRGNIQNTMALFRSTFQRVFDHHLVATTPTRVSPTGSSTMSEPTETENDSSSESSTTSSMLLSVPAIKELRKQLDAAVPQLLKEQATLLHDSEMEPSLWKPPFSLEKYRGVLDASHKVLAHLRMLLDLVEWHAKRRAAALNGGYDTRLRRARKSHIEGDIRAAYDAQHQEEEQQRMSGDGSDTGGLLPPLTLSPPLGPTPGRPRGMTRQKSMMIRALPWDQSQNAFVTGVDEAFDTLTTLFGKEFAGSDAADHAIFLQMKEAFRLADVHRRGEVNASELVVLLEKLMPYAGGQGHVQILDQYVDEFMALVDKNHDGKITFAEFMQALNEGFRLELEMYENDNILGAKLETATSSPSNSDGQHLPQLVPTKSMRLITTRQTSQGSVDSTEEELSDDSSATSTKAVQSSPPLTAAVPDTSMTSSFIDVSKLGTYIFGTGPTTNSTESSSEGLVPDSSRSWTSSAVTASASDVGSSRRFALPRRSSSSESSAPEALLNVESFSIRDAASALKQSYGEFLLAAVDDQEKRVAMEDFMVMSCLISACEDLAATLAALSALAAS